MSGRGVSYLANDVDTPRAARDKVGLLAMDFLEPRKELLPSLGFDWNCILGVDVAQRCRCWYGHYVMWVYALQNKQ